MSLVILYTIFYLLAGFLVVTVAFKLEPPEEEDRIVCFIFGWLLWPVIIFVIAYIMLKHFLTRYINFIVK